jgi:cation transporter-like permease
MINDKNYLVITSQLLIMGLPLQGWMISALFGGIGANIIKFFAIPFFAFVGALIIFSIILIFLIIKTKQEPDYVSIKITKLFKIKDTTNKNFKGNCYIA